MKEVMMIICVYGLIGCLVQLLFYKKMSAQISMLACGDNATYFNIVVRFVVLWPVVVYRLIKYR